MIGKCNGRYYNSSRIGDFIPIITAASPNLLGYMLFFNGNEICFDDGIIDIMESAPDYMLKDGTRIYSQILELDLVQSITVQATAYLVDELGNSEELESKYFYEVYLEDRVDSFYENAEYELLSLSVRVQGKGKVYREQGTNDTLLEALGSHLDKYGVVPGQIAIAYNYKRRHIDA